MTDLRFAFRQLLKNPGFTAVAVLTLALGIGANTAMFSLVNMILLRPLPFPESRRLMRIFGTSERSQREGISVGDFRDLRDGNHGFEHVALYYPEWTFNLAQPGEPADRLSGVLVSSDFFTTIGVPPELGRTFREGEDRAGHEPVVILSHETWRQRFQGDAGIVGRTIRLDGQSATVVGVMPASFDCPLAWGKAEVWLPFSFTAPDLRDRGQTWRFACGRLKPGVDLARARAEMGTLSLRLAQAYPTNDARRGVRLLPLRESLSEGDNSLSWLSLGITSFVLLIACANLGGLQLARISGRAHELAVRSALGATRWRLLRQLFTESLLLSLVGGALALVLANWAAGYVGHRIIAGDQAGFEIPMDGRVVTFTLLCVALASFLFGTLPAWISSRRDDNHSLQDAARTVAGARHQQRWRQRLVVGEVALAMVLLTGAGLFIDGFETSLRRDPGWRVDNLLTGQLDLTASKYVPPQRRLAFLDELEERLAALPGVKDAAFSATVPVRDPRIGRDIVIEGRPPPRPGQELHVRSETVSPGYFRTVGIQLKRGRLFADSDTAETAGVVVINETMARRFWPVEDPIGKRIGRNDPASPAWRTVVGVVGDARFPAEFGSDYFPGPQVYCPLTQDPPEFAAVELRVTGSSELVARGLRQAVAGIDPDQPVYSIATARSLIERGARNLSLLGAMLGAFAALGLILSALGIYGVTSYFVAQRTGEIGIRMALGARRPDVLWLVLRRGLIHGFLGALLGMAGAFGLARLLIATVPFPLSVEPSTLAGAVVVLVGSALLACFVPARRATLIDPMEALRNE